MFPSRDSFSMLAEPILWNFVALAYKVMHRFGLNHSVCDTSRESVQASALPLIARITVDGYS